jgi:hypothetical protein
MNWNHSGPKCIINCSLVDMFSTALEALDTLAVRGGIMFFRMAQPVTKVAAISLELEC